MQYLRSAAARGSLALLVLSPLALAACVGTAYEDLGEAASMEAETGAGGGGAVDADGGGAIDADGGGAIDADGSVGSGSSDGGVTGTDGGAGATDAGGPGPGDVDGGPGAPTDAGAPPTVDAGTTPPTGDVVPSSTHCAPAAGWAAAVAADEDEVLRLVNVARAAGAVCGGESFPPAPALRMQSQLRCAARLHGRDMGENGYFSHTGLDGSNVGMRVTRTGYSFRGWGENIARGQRSPRSVVDGWLGSPGHCRNIMNAGFTEIGVGKWESGGPYWVQVFGTPR